MMNTGGLRAAPTPPGVPVTITSPGTSSVKVEQYSMSSAKPCTSRSAVAFCITSPFRRVVISSLSRSPISSGVIIQGPKPPVLAKFFPGVNWDVWRCHSRTLPSL